jgi:hypothetical protein
LECWNVLLHGAQTLFDQQWQRTAASAVYLTNEVRLMAAATQAR